MIRAKIRDELPTLLKLYRADKFLVNKIVASASTFFEEVRRDPKHPFRGEFDRMVLLVRRPHRDRQGLWRTSRRSEARLPGAARLGDLARTVWSNTRSFIERSASGETQVLENHLVDVRRRRRGARPGR